MDLVKKKKIKTLNELNTFNNNKADIQRELRVLGLTERHMDRFQRELEDLNREHDRRLKRLKWVMRFFWITLGLQILAQAILLIIKLSK
jgi:hypothetical protein